jgi:hypothetical protein
VDLTISRPIRIFALVALVAAIGGGAMLVMRPKPAVSPPVLSSDATAKPAVVVPHNVAKATASPKAKPPVVEKTTRPAATVATTPAAPKAAPAAAPPKPKAAQAVAANGLPMAIAKALRKHRIVVVALFDPESRTDAVSYAEARAGAGESGAGFVGISLLDSVAAGALTTAAGDGGLLPSPGVLIYRRPGSLVYRIDGFADRDTIAEAAAMSVTAAPLNRSGE